MGSLTAATLRVRVAWGQWTIACLVVILIGALIGGGSGGQGQAMEVRPSPRPPPTQGDIPDGFDSRRESLHFILLWRQGEPSSDDIDATAASAEQLFARLSAELGQARTPTTRLIITFEGPGIAPTGQCQLPYTDVFGRIHLFRFPGPGRRYLGNLGHELVHAFRLDWWSRHRRDRGSGFVEEGFAVFMATRMEPDSSAFPYYGVPIPVVVGQWFLNNEAPPLQVFMARHAWLNLRCLTQAYTLRGSFFHYLSDTFGQEAVFRLVYTEEPVTPAVFEPIFGRDFDTLVTDWRTQAVQQFWAVAEAPQLARDYRAKTREIYVCQPGTDY